MNIEHHDLHHEFPEFSEAIRRLKMENAHFARLFDEYHDLTSRIEDIESKDSPIEDLSLEEMKKNRVRLKDDLYRMLQVS